MTRIVPAFLERDAASLKRRFSEIRSRRYHIDIMDGTFLPHRTIGASALPRRRDAFVEAHLMVDDPVRKMKKYVGVADMVIAHIETLKDIDAYVKSARKCGFEVGIALDPETPIKRLAPHAAGLDRILVMTVKPGMQGAPFDPRGMAKVRLLHRKFPKISIAVDGGIHHGTARMAAKAGADTLIVGSAIVHADDPMRALQELQREVR